MPILIASNKMSSIEDLPEIEKQILSIRRHIISSMNGVVADSMVNKGVVYKKNFGVDIPRLRQLAKNYPESSELADRLWVSQVREMMILAIYLHPLATFTCDKAERWLNSVEQIELVEQLCMYLFSELNYAPQLALNWVTSTDTIKQITAFSLAARIGNVFTQTQMQQIIEHGLAISETDDFHLFKSIATCFGRFCRRNEADALDVKNSLIGFKKSKHRSEQYIYKEVENELIFLGYQ